MLNSVNSKISLFLLFIINIYIKIQYLKMRIKRFNESEQVDISTERVDEIIVELKELTSMLDSKQKMVDSFISEFNDYKNKSDKGNDQIDDSIAALQVIKKELENSVDKTDTVVNNLESYKDDGRKYLYTENK